MLILTKDCEIMSPEDSWTEREMDNLESWDRLAMAREAKGLSQGKMASMLGMTQQAYHNYEHGREMKASMICKVCAILECSPSWLLGIDDDGMDVPPESPLMRELRSAFERLNKKGQQKVVGYANDLTGNVEYRVSVKKSDEDNQLPVAVGQ